MKQLQDDLLALPRNKYIFNNSNSHYLQIRPGVKPPEKMNERLPETHIDSGDQTDSINPEAPLFIDIRLFTLWEGSDSSEKKLEERQNVVDSTLLF